jgi:DMSO/TMAO reductase YedYZ heme-binding membrane subunit
MSWSEWFDLKLMDIIFQFYIAIAIIAFLILLGFMIAIINIIKNK